MLLPLFKDAASEPEALPTAETTLPVSVQAVTEKTVPIQIQAVGTVQAYATVSVKAQVDGELVAVHFKDGQCVAAGAPLFTIDPRFVQAQLKQMQAALAKTMPSSKTPSKSSNALHPSLEKGMFP